MSIKTIEHHIQVEGLKKGSRKNNIYNVLISSPIEVKDIDANEVTVAGIKNEEKNVVVDGRVETGIIMKKYIEYNGLLYEGLVDEINNKTIPISEEDYIYKTKEMPGNYYNRTNVKDNIDINITTLDPDFKVAQMDDFKNIVKTNEKYCINNINKSLDDVICINGEIYIKSFGPLFIYYDYGYTYDHNISETKFYPQYFSHPFLHTDKKEHIYKSFFDLLPFNLLHGFDTPSSSVNKIIHAKECYQFYNIDALQKSNKDVLGRHLFETTIGQALNLTLSFHHKKTYKFIPELQRNNFLEKIYQSYDFGMDFKKQIRLCEENNYNLNMVMDLLEFIKSNIKNFNDTRNTINTEKTHIKKTYDSDKRIFRDVILDYDKDFILNILKKPNSDKCNFLLNGDRKTFYEKRDLLMPRIENNALKL